MVSSMSVTAANAHSPTSVSLSSTETTVTISWTHSGAAGCATSDSGSSCLTDVDIMRVPGQSCATNCEHGVNVSNATAYVVANNATSLSSWTDHSLPEGTVFGYQVCHNEPNKEACTTALTDGTNEGNSDQVFITTKASKINATSINFSIDKNSVVVDWAGPQAANNTAVTGLKIEYSSDGGSSYTTATSNSTEERSAVAYKVTGLQTSTDYIFRVAAVTESKGDTGVTSKSATGNTGTTSQFGPFQTLPDQEGIAPPPPKATSYSSGTITGGNLQVTVKENSGWDRTLKRCSLY